MGSCTENTFRYETRATQTATAAAGWAVENFGTNVWVHNADYLWGNSVADAWKAQAQSSNGDVNIVGETASELGERVDEEIVRHAIELGGTSTGEHGVGRGKGKYLPDEYTEGTVDVMKRVKAAFDPNGILNPGKVFPSE